MALKRQTKIKTGDRGSQKKHRKVTKPQEDEEIDSDVEFETPPPTDDEAEEEPTTADSALSVEEKRLLLAQECLRRMGLEAAAAEVEEAAKTLMTAPADPAAGQTPLISVAEELVCAAPIVYQAAGHRATCLAVSPDDATVYTGGKDCKIYQWNVETGQKVAFPGKAGDVDCGGHFAEVYDMTLAMNGRLLISVGRDEIVRVWDTRKAGQAQIGEMRGHTKAINCVSCSGDAVYTGSDDKSLRTWSVLTQRMTGAEFGHTTSVVSMDVLDYDHVLTGGTDRTARFWKIAHNKHSILQDVEAGTIDAVAMINSHNFLSGGQNGKLSLWSLSRKKPLKQASIKHVDQTCSGWVSAVAVMRKTDCAFSGSDTGVVQVWKATPAQGGELRALQDIPMDGVVNQLRVADSGAFLFGATSKEARLGRWVTKKTSNVGLVIVPLSHSSILTLN